ncbi:MAG: hypothetical protein K2J95_05710 [Lachnospiraceae bacterium]|nr:hypothetical protein [Lachnospiraceae bacterium]
MLLTNAQTDCLASRNIFYNKRTNKIADNINEVLDPDHIEFHAEGLRNYLDYGYSVFGQTFVEDVHILPANHRIWTDEEGKIQIEELKDPFEDKLDIPSKPQETLECIRAAVSEWEQKAEGTIIIPTSSGFDSRLLNCMISAKDRIHAYTYGISDVQSQSQEVVYAKKLCEILQIDWHQIELGKIHNYFEEWYKLYGFSTHAHGMYQMEFYDIIGKIENNCGNVLSGIYGDLWAGNWKFDNLKNSRDLENLAITHGLHADSAFCKLSEKHEIRDAFYEKHREKLKDEKWRIIFAARMKMVLLSYLLQVPQYYGFSTWSPFINVEVISQMINLDRKEKERRKWQVDYFKSNGVLIGEMGLVCDANNTLNVTACHTIIPEPLNVKLLGTLMEEHYVESINKKLPAINHIADSAYCGYLTLFPLQKILEIKEYGREK